MQQVNHKMIELARNSRKMKQKELSELLPKFNQPTLSKIERGELGLAYEDLIEISKALDYPVEFFYQDSPKTPLSNLYFRKRATLPQRDLEKIYSEIQIILKGIDNLLDHIEIKEYNRYSFDLSKDGWTPESVAARMREILGYDRKEPIKHIVRKIEEQGILVYLFDSSHAKFDGLTAYTDNGTPVIFANKNQDNERLKFTIVHELFHLVMHLPCDIEPWRDYEQEANAATSNFYLPKDACINEFRDLNYRKLGLLKSYWGVSKSAIVMRAKQLDLIDEGTYRYMYIELGRRGERVHESGYVDFDKPMILTTVVDLIKNELGLSPSDIAKAVKMNSSDYGRYFDPSQGAQIKLRVVKSIV